MTRLTATDRPIVALSGGVDSAVVAYLLKSQGLAVEALHMTNWDDDEDGYCTAKEDLKAARSVADFLNIPLHHVSFAKEYREKIFANFIDLYAMGLTPNPDVLCNREVKFAACLSYAKRLGGSHLVTGHYATVIQGSDGYELHRGIDPLKDQSYFLQQMPYSALAQSLFPLGAYTKAQIREIAKQARLPVYDRKDSTGICFIGERPFKEFLSRYVHSTQGPIESVSGEVIGEHQGLSYYTIGQRQGLGVGGRKDSDNSAWYVARKDAARNTLIVAQGEDHPALLSQQFWVIDPHWLCETQLPTCANSDSHPQASQPWPYRLADHPSGGLTVRVQIRHRGESILGSLVPVFAQSTDNSVNFSPSRLLRAKVTLDHPFRYIAPGQYAAFYSAERCLGGAQITHALTQSGDIIGASLGEIYEPPNHPIDRRITHL